MKIGKLSFLWHTPIYTYTLLHCVFTTEDFWTLLWHKVVFINWLLFGFELCCAKLLQLCLTLCDPMEPTRLLCPWDSPGKNTGGGCHALLQRIFPTQGSSCLGAQRSGLRFLENSSHSIACMFPRLRTCKISVSWLVRILPLPDTAALGKSPGVPRVLAVPRTALGTWDPAPAWGCHGFPREPWAARQQVGPRSGTWELEAYTQMEHDELQRPKSHLSQPALLLRRQWASHSTVTVQCHHLSWHHLCTENDYSTEN